MPRHAVATPDHEEPPGDGRRERVVSMLSVTAVVVAALAAAVVDDGAALRADGLRAAGALGQTAAPAPCAECGVVATAVPLGRAPSGQGAWQVRIRMDDGSERTVQHDGALAAGSRVLVAGGSVRVLSRPARRG